MSERDAFGRRRDEDALAGMGWREPTFMATLEGAGDSETAEIPLLHADRGDYTPAATRPRLPRRHRRRRDGAGDGDAAVHA